MALTGPVSASVILGQQGREGFFFSRQPEGKVLQAQKIRRCLEWLWCLRYTLSFTANSPQGWKVFLLHKGGSTVPCGLACGNVSTDTTDTLVIERLFGGNAAKAEWDFSVFLQRRKMGGGCSTTTCDEQF